MALGPGQADGAQRMVLAELIADQAGWPSGYAPNVSSMDAGPAWADSAFNAIQSSNATSGMDLTAEIPPDDELRITDVIISVDTDMKVTIEEATNDVSGNARFVVFMAANTTIQITTRGWLTVAGASGKKIRAITSAAGNIAVTLMTKAKI